MLPTPAIKVRLPYKLVVPDIVSSEGLPLGQLMLLTDEPRANWTTNPAAVVMVRSSTFELVAPAVVPKSKRPLPPPPVSVIPPVPDHVKLVAVSIRNKSMSLLVSVMPPPEPKFMARVLLPEDENRGAVKVNPARLIVP